MRPPSLFLFGVVAILSGCNSLTNFSKSFSEGTSLSLSGTRPAPVLFPSPVITPTTQPSLPAPAPSPTNSGIGSFSEVFPTSTDSSHQIQGWACEPDSSQPLTVEIYVIGPPGTGEQWLEAVADQSTSLSQNCANPNSGFSITISDSDFKLHESMVLFAYAVSADGTLIALNNSGSVVLSQVPSSATINSQVTGYFNQSSPNAVSGSYTLFGWAALEGTSDSITVEIYINGPIGQGTLWKQAMVSAPDFSYSIPLTSAELQQYNGQMVYAYGVGPDGRYAELKNSGVFPLNTAPATN